MNIEAAIKGCVEKFYRLINSSEPYWVTDNQEIILLLFSLFTNRKFQKRIMSFRKKLKVPEELYSDNKSRDSFKTWIEWTYTKKTHPPTIESSGKELLTICKEFHLDAKKYDLTIMCYLYFNDIMLPDEERNDWNWRDFLVSNEDYRFKANFEIDYFNDKGIETTAPQRAYIRFFEDTTPKQLKNFIDKNKDKIKYFQKGLKAYPHESKYSMFRRELLVYLLYLKGNTPLQISSDFAQKNISDISPNQISNIVRKLRKQVIKLQK